MRAQTKGRLWLIVGCLIIACTFLSLSISPTISAESKGIMTTQGLADSQWPCFQGNGYHTGLSLYDTSNVDGTLRWNYSIADSSPSDPVIGRDGTIYVGSIGLHEGIYAFDSNGTLKWSFAIAGGVLSSPAIDAEGTIYAGTWAGLPDGFYALNPNGTLKWSYATSGAMMPPAIGKDGTIYVGAFNISGSNSGINHFNLYAFNQNGTLKWLYGRIGAMESSPAIDSSGVIYFSYYENNYQQPFGNGGSLTIYNGTLCALYPNGTEKWSYKSSSGVVTSSPSIGKDGTIYYGSSDYSLTALNPDGTIKWWYFTGGPVTSSPAIGPDSTIYIGSSDGKMNAVNPNGTLRWSYVASGMMASSPAIGKEGTIYFSTYNKGICALNSDGTLRWSSNLTGSESWYRWSLAIGNGTIIIGSTHGLYTFGGSTNILLILLIPSIAIIIAVPAAILLIKRRRKNSR